MMKIRLPSFLERRWEPVRPLRALAFLAATLLATNLAGCTVRQYEISGAELERLARIDSAERGRRVQVVQQTAYDRSELGPGEEALRHDEGAALLIAGGSREHRRSRSTRSQSSDGSQSNDGDTDAGELAAVAALALVATGVVLVPIGVTEGLRYDGFVTLSEDQPLYLVGTDRWVRLGDLSPGEARASEGAIAPDWGDPITRLERRPLDRVGLGYTLELGGAALAPPEGDRLPAYGGRLQLGGHPIQRLGVFVGGQFAYGSAGDDRLFLGKLFADVEFLPASLGIFHAGLFVEAGYSHFVHSRHTTVATSEPYFSGGPLFQLALSTRLALALRGGMSSIATPGGRTWLPEVSFGIAVY